MVNSALKNTLREQWEHLLQLSGVEASRADEAFAAICSAYCQTTRHYHTLEHIEAMLTLLHHSGFAQAEALWATWYHDYIYIAGRTDNEQRSADIAAEVMCSLGLDDQLIQKCTAIILATTQHQAIKPDPVLQAVLDADMAILGCEPANYQRYCVAVRKEYAAIPSLLYRQGRKRFLNNVLNSERIFNTPWFYERFEPQARENIAAELKRL